MVHISFRLDKLTREEKIQFMKLNGIAYEEVYARSFFVLCYVNLWI